MNLPSAPGFRPVPGASAAVRCPTCGSALAEVGVPGDQRSLCPRCGRCWQRVGSGLRRTDPVTCPGCGAKSRLTCIEMLADDLWHFVGGAS
jgi:DNA-directed RNA polymerase subunit RPC12/RpoP